jgi:hypothetical protein
VKIPQDATIATEKLTHYLLFPRPFDDKSKFLGRLGFDRSRPFELELAIRNFVSENDATSDGENEYGEFLRVEGELVGPSGIKSRIVQIWIR